ncbi:MAG: hypothetical protein HQ475_12200 [SAR202 cluster bacterium]|nr:hypothetical protein [SAR202 cluster bacterium]
MPMRVGFSAFRRQMLERDLVAIEEMLPILGVEKVILTGDMAAEDFSPDTKIELIIVHDTEYSFGRRADFFSYHLPCSVDIDTLVYTPAEFEEMREKLPALGKAVREGREIYNA